MILLNPEQKKAVEHAGGPLLILAGAGSGKTRVIVHRIVRLISEGILPSEILAVTFTNKASNEMRERIEKLIGSCAKDIALGTFHSICLRILKADGEKVSLGRNFVVYDSDDQESLIKKCLIELNIDPKKFTPRSVAEKISRLKDDCIGCESYSSSADNFYMKIVAKIYELYQSKLIQLQAVDFGDLIKLTVELFRRDDLILNKYSNRWKYILVDEYQDTNRAQYLFLKMLAEKHKNICAVGDDDQSIYKWRGADIRNILEFEKDFESAKVIRLEQNYRSSKNILDTAGAVIANNSGRKPKTLWTEKKAGDLIKLVTATNEESEAEFISSEITDNVINGARYSDHAIFYRINAQSRALEDAFRIKRIPYKLIGTVRFFERREIKDIISYLKVIIHPKDDISLKRIINVPPRGIGDITFKRFESVSNNEGVYFALNKVEGRAKALNCARDLFNILEGIRKDLYTKSIEEIIATLIDETGYALWIMKEEMGEERLANINELMNIASKFITPDDEIPLKAFLDNIALSSSVDELNEDEGYVTLMTLHLAKGLEFKNVHIVGLEEGLLPHSKSINESDELEEERRLLYVGMTRAKECLNISHTLSRRIFGKRNYSYPSRFIDEMPKDKIKRIKYGKTDNFEFENKSTITSDDYFDQRPDSEIAEYAVGKYVVHPVFGKGIIKSCQKSTIGHKVTVAFSMGAVKNLIAEYANLKTIV